MKFFHFRDKIGWQLPLASGITIFLIALITGWCLREEYDPVFIKKKSEEKLHRMEKILQDEIRVLDTAEFKTDPRFFKHKVEKFISDPALTGLSVFIYRSDSLLFWTDNDIPVSRSFDDFRKQYPLNFGKIGNCWSEIIIHEHPPYQYIGLISVAREYPFENDYLQNRPVATWPFPGKTVLKTTRSEGISIVSDRGHFLFSAQIPEEKEITESLAAVLLGIYLAGFILFMVALYRFFRQIAFLVQFRILMVVAVLVVMTVIRLLIQYFRIPGILYDSLLFSPVLYSSSFLIPSLGDLIINCILGLFAATVIFFQFGTPEIIQRKTRLLYVLRIVLTGAILAGCFYLLITLVDSIVINSSVPFDLRDISGFGLTGMLLLFALSALTVSFVLIAIPLIRNAARPLTKNRNPDFRLSLPVVVILLVFFSGILTLRLNFINDKKELEKRKLLLLKLGEERDPVAEQLFLGMERDLLRDPRINSLLEKLRTDSTAHASDSLNALLRHDYFSSRWNNYTILATACFPGKQLRVQPQNVVIGCGDYFGALLSDYGKTTIAKQLYFLDYGFGYRNYLAVLPAHSDVDNSDSLSKIFVEISSRLVFKELGYPQLLIDKKLNSVPDLSGYSYAFYRNENLVQRVGSFYYPMLLSSLYHDATSSSRLFSSSGFNHLMSPIGTNKILIISKKEYSVLAGIAPFSYLFFTFSIFSLILLAILRSPLGIVFIFQHLGDRLQVWMTGILVVSLFVIGFLSVSYIVKLNTQKNQDNLRDRAFSVLAELQHKVSTGFEFKSGNRDEIAGMLIKFSNVFFTDITLFDPHGWVLASSRPQVYDENLVSERMNPVAFNMLRYDGNTFFIQKERIGELEFLSAYIPVYDDDNRLMVFLNVPAFARQEELRREVSTYLVAFINSYLLIILLGIFISLLVSNYIIRPLRMLTRGISGLNLRGPVEKLQWNRNDEIGRLVDEYNRMTDELARSAEALAKSERETAWREMARQVAHEIKNPLTPMKLSVQHLQRSWSENDPEWEVRLDKFARSMTEQIDNLSDISSEFSDFAQMPSVRNETIGVNHLVENVAEMYRHSPDIEIEWNTATPEVYILADRRQMVRVMVNLVNNAIQAIGKRERGRIRIGVAGLEESVEIEVEDNGDGIDAGVSDRIFQPNFTTRTSGSGLGLAIVKSILSTAGGTIRFNSGPSGTVFTVSLPRLFSPEPESTSL